MDPLQSLEEDLAIAESLEADLVNGANIEQQKQNHRIKFEEWLNKNYEEKKTSFILKKSDIDLIFDVLKGNKKLNDAQHKFQFKKQNILWLTIMFAELLLTKIL